MLLVLFRCEVKLASGYHWWTVSQAMLSIILLLSTQKAPSVSPLPNVLKMLSYPTCSCSKLLEDVVVTCWL